MIIHFLNGNQIHLGYGIAKGLISVYSISASPYIVIIGETEKNKKSYESLFHELKFENYQFLDGLCDLARFVRNNCNQPMLFHNGKYEWFMITFLCRANNVSWVCWGSGASIGKSWISKLITPIKKYLYGRFKKIVTLMDDDRDTIIQDFCVNPNVIQTIPYAFNNNSKIDSLREQLFSVPSHVNEKPLVLLGNNPHNMSCYIDMLQRLAPFKGKIRVHCMNQYSLKRNALYKRFKDVGNELFQEDFSSDEVFLNMEEYIHYMNQCDIYICSRDSQTGLGAISNCMMLGKKIYLHGKNLHWIQSYYGARVFDTDIITSEYSFEEFAKPLSIEERSYNKNIIIKKYSQCIKTWHDCLKEMDVKLNSYSKHER